jgi:predicted nucleotidyltransferase
MPLPNIGALRAVADGLDKLGLDYAFIGGSIVSLLVDDPELSPARVTDDVDVILEVVTSKRYSDVEARLRSLGFDHDMSHDTHRCRWVFGGDLKVDIMPTDGNSFGLNTKWFKEALATAVSREFAHTSLRLISPIAFLATKYVAFLDRGKSDYYASHDLEDFITVIDGRANIVSELDQTPVALRAYVISAARDLQAIAPFNEALSGHLPSDQASQQRLPLLRKKLRDIGALS